MASDSTPYVAFATLGVGMSRAEVIRAKTSIQIPNTDGIGCLAARGKHGDWTWVDRHPDTGAIFAGLQIPDFAQAVADCLVLHERVPQFGLIGWDVAINRDERAELIEWNTGHTGIVVAEAAIGQTLRQLNLEQFRTHLWSAPRRVAP